MSDSVSILARYKRFCHTNKIIFLNRVNKNILLQQQNIKLYKKKGLFAAAKLLVAATKKKLFSLILLP